MFTCDNVLPQGVQSDRQTQTEPGVREMFTCDNVLPQGVHAEEVDGLQHSLQSQQQVGPVGQVDKPLHAFPRVVGRPGLHHPAQQNPGHVVGSPEDPPTAVQRLAGALWDMEMVVTDAGSCSNSKHWFTTSFLQPLPYLVTPYGPENSARFRFGSLFSVFKKCCPSQLMKLGQTGSHLRM